MPVQTVVLREDGAAGEAELRAQLAIERISLRRENRQRIRAALEEDAHENGLCRPGGSCRDAFLERGEAEPRGAVDGEHCADALRDERAAGQPRSCRQWHAGLE